MFFFFFLAVRSIPIYSACVCTCMEITSREKHWLHLYLVLDIHQIFINVKAIKRKPPGGVLDAFLFFLFFPLSFSQIKWSFVLSIYMYIYTYAILYYSVIIPKLKSSWT